jgi:hypothetical protein
LVTAFPQLRITADLTDGDAFPAYIWLLGGKLKDAGRLRYRCCWQ